METDPELIPEILPSETRLALQGSASELLGVITRASRVVPDKEVVPGTSFVLLEARESVSGTQEYLRASATDGTIFVSAIGDDCVVRHAGAALIPGQKLKAILKMVPEDLVAIQVIGNEALIRSGQSQWKVQLPPGDSLPSSYVLTGITPVVLDRMPFLASLKAAEAAASHTSARAALMQVKVRDGHITGQDGNRIHRAFFSDNSDLEMSIPLSTCLEVIQMLEASEDSHFRAGTDGRKMVFSADKDYVVSSSMIVDFPDVDPILIRSSMNVRNSLTLNTEELSNAIKRVRVNSDPDFSSIFLAVAKSREGQWGASLRSIDRQGNSAHEFLSAHWDGPQAPREFCVNHKNLSDLLDSYPGVEVTFKVGDDTQSAKSPLLVEDDSRFIGLLQQMRSDYLN